MELKISYIELDFLRKLLKKEKMRIWRESFLPRLPDKSDENVIKVFEELMESELPLGFSPMTDTERCKLLLQKINKIELEIKEEIESEES